MGRDPERSCRKPLLKKPVGGGCAKSLGEASRKNSPEAGLRSNPTSNLQSGFPGSHPHMIQKPPQAWAPHSKASLPAGCEVQVTKDRHRESDYLQQEVVAPRAISARSTPGAWRCAPRCLEMCPQLKAHLQVRVPGRRSEGSKWTEGTSPHWILSSFSFWGFSKETKPFKHKSPF